MNWQLITRTSIYDVEYPHSIRNASGLMVMFPHRTCYEGQMVRYVQECKEMMDTAQKILEFLKKSVDTIDQPV